MLTRKLHLKPGMRFTVVNAPDGFAKALGKPPAGLTQEASFARDLDLVIVFALNQKGLKGQWPKALAALKSDGALWVSYPKKSSGIQTDLAMGEWGVTKGSGWNPVSMIAIDDTWSAVRFKLAPGLAESRDARAREVVRDADGTVCIDRGNRSIRAPGDLRKLLDRNAKAHALFEALSFTHKREYVSWIIGARKPETRAARLTKTIKMLANGRKSPSGA